MNPPLDLEQVAARMLADYDCHDPGTVFAEGLSLTLKEAYRVQSLVADLRMARGEQVIGYKVGCTSPVIRQRLNAKHPVFGRLFETECWESGVSLPTNGFANLAIEGEMAVRLSHDLARNNPSDAELLAAIGSVFAVIELHNLVFRRDQPSIEELVANNAIHAGFVRAKDGSASLEADLGSLRIELDGTGVVSVGGDQLHETILSSLRWLTGELDRHNRHLQENQIVLCGSVADLFPVSNGSIVGVITDKFGSVDCTVLPPS